MEIPRDVVEAIIHNLGKLAVEEGEPFRLSHPELMDAFQELCRAWKSIEGNNNA